MPLELIPLTVGPWPMNMYILICPETQRGAIIDPGAEAERILETVGDARVVVVLVPRVPERFELLPR